MKPYLYSKLLVIIYFFLILPILSHEKSTFDCQSQEEKIQADFMEFHYFESEEETYSQDPLDIFNFDHYHLENNHQDFILETKEIKVPEFPNSFNPSIALWKGKILMSFRIREPLAYYITNRIGFIWLDENFNCVSSPYVLDLPASTRAAFSKEQDPRLLTIDDRLYMIYSNAIKGLEFEAVRRMFVTEIHFDGDKFFADTPQGLFYFEGEKEKRWEKNWMPFEYQGNLLLAYSLIPHRILRLLGNEKCETYASTLGDIQWEWGTLRGGTPAILDGDQYLSFFHSSIKIGTLHSNEEIMPHYFMGAYTFSAHPPFSITQISPTPIIGKDFYTSPPYKTWRPLRVVFPCGILMKENHIWVVYGKQDFEMWVVKLDKKRLLQSLVPVNSML